MVGDVIEIQKLTDWDSLIINLEYLNLKSEDNENPIYDDFLLPDSRMTVDLKKMVVKN